MIQNISEPTACNKKKSDFICRKPAVTEAEGGPSKFILKECLIIGAITRIQKFC